MRLSENQGMNQVLSAPFPTQAVCQIKFEACQVKTRQPDQMAPFYPSASLQQINQDSPIFRGLFRDQESLVAVFALLVRHAAIAPWILQQVSVLLSLFLCHAWASELVSHQIVDLLVVCVR